MSRDVAVTVAYGENTIQFYRDEVRDVIKQPLRFQQVRENGNTVPGIETEGGVWNTLQMRICDIYADSAERIQTLTAIRDVMTVHYAVGKNPDLELKCILYPEFEKTILFGHQSAAKSETVLTLLECE